MNIRNFFRSGSWDTSAYDIEPMSDELERRLTAYELHVTYSRGFSVLDTLATLKKSAPICALWSRLRSLVPAAAVPVKH